MRKKLFFILIIGVISLFLGVFLSACSSRIIDESQLIKDGNVRIKFDFMGGSVSNRYYEKVVYGMPDTFLIEPGVIVGGAVRIAAPILTGHVLEGWYTSYTEEGDEKTFDEQDKWDFSTDRVKAEMTLYAKWKKLLSYTILFMHDADTQTENTKVYYLNDGDTIFDIPENDAPTWPNNTLIDYYYDAALTELVEFPLTHTGGKGSENINIYSEWIEGDYTIIRSAADLKSIEPNTNYYIMNDLDFSEEGAKWSPQYSYAGIMKGCTKNGKGITIRNISYVIDDTLSSGLVQTSFGLIAEFYGGTLQDITFEDCSVTVKARENYPKPMYIAFLTGTAGSKSVFTNVTLKNCSVSLINYLNVNYVMRDAIAFEEANGVTKTNCDFSGVTRHPAA